MLAGEGFGDAVHKARSDVYEEHGKRTNTWGAYQCYGDPFYRLTPGRKDSTPLLECRYVDLDEAIMDINNLSQRAKIAVANRISNLREELQDTVVNIQCTNDHWLDDPRINEALGRAYGEVDLFEQAAQHYQKAFDHPKSQISIKSIEQMANLRARWAVQLQDTEQACALIAESIRQLRKLRITMGDTTERLALIGSAYKRRAQISQKEPRREALVKMERYYRKAWELNPSNTYPLLNMLVAQSARFWNGMIETYPEDLEENLKIAEQLTHDQKESNPEYFWCAIGTADYQLAHFMIKGEGDDIIETLTSEYINNWKRYGSARELSSVVEHLEFLIAILQRDQYKDPYNDSRRGKKRNNLRVAFVALQSKLNPIVEV
jgi:tetratricopeptide (TPR) repeat protein